jgi:hypothetical protein
MLHEIRTLVVTGDAATAHPIRERLERRFPDMAVETTHTPSGLCLDYDVFVVDCPTVGTSVARMLRNENPQAFLLVFTDDLDGEALRDLLNAACNAACDRVDEEQLEAALDEVRDYVAQRTAAPEHTGLLGVVRSMSELLKLWNRRLDAMEAS